MSNTIYDRSKNSKKIITGKEAQATRLVYECRDVLVSHYPDHPWRVTISTDYSTINVHLMNLHGNYGMVLHTMDVQNDPSKKGVVMLAGELLERASLKRGKFTEEPVDFDISGAGNKRLIDKDITFKKVLK